MEDETCLPRNIHNVSTVPLFQYHLEWEQDACRDCPSESFWSKDCKLTRWLCDPTDTKISVLWKQILGYGILYYLNGFTIAGQSNINKWLIRFQIIQGWHNVGMESYIKIILERSKWKPCNKLWGLMFCIILFEYYYVNIQHVIWLSCMMSFRGLYLVKTSFLMTTSQL